MEMTVQIPCLCQGIPSGDLDWDFNSSKTKKRGQLKEGDNKVHRASRKRGGGGGEEVGGRRGRGIEREVRGGVHQERSCKRDRMIHKVVQQGILGGHTGAQ